MPKFGFSKTDLWESLDFEKLINGKIRILKNWFLANFGSWTTDFCKIRILKNWFSAKFLFLLTDFRQNSVFDNLIFSKIRLLKICCYSKFDFWKYDFGQNSTFEKLIFLYFTDHGGSFAIPRWLFSTPEPPFSSCHLGQVPLQTSLKRTIKSLIPIRIVITSTFKKGQIRDQKSNSVTGQVVDPENPKKIIWPA